MMTVQELIDELQKYDKTMRVTIALGKESEFIAKVERASIISDGTIEKVIVVR